MLTLYSDLLKVQAVKFFHNCTKTVYLQEGVDRGSGENDHRHDSINHFGYIQTSCEIVGLVG